MHLLKQPGHCTFFLHRCVLFCRTVSKKPYTSTLTLYQVSKSSLLLKKKQKTKKKNI